MSDSLFQDDLMLAKRQAVTIRQVPISRDQPLQILRARNGVFLYGCKTMDEVDSYLERTSFEMIAGGILVSRHCSR